MTPSPRSVFSVRVAAVVLSVFFGSLLAPASSLAYTPPSRTPAWLAKCDMSKFAPCGQVCGDKYRSKRYRHDRKFDECSNECRRRFC